MEAQTAPARGRKPNPNKEKLTALKTSIKEGNAAARDLGREIKGKQKEAGVIEREIAKLEKQLDKVLAAVTKTESEIKVLQSA